MATLNLIKIKEELLNLIRNSDILSISQRGVTTATQNFTATAGQTNFVVTNSGVKNIRSVVVQSVTQTLYTDYDINIFGKTATESQTITLVVPATLNDVVTIVYDYGTGDKIYGDFPEDFLSVGSFPRIGFEIVSISNKNRSCNDTLQQKSIYIEFGTFSENNLITTYSTSLYDLIFANRKTLFYLKLLRPSGRSGRAPYKKFSTTTVYEELFSYTCPNEFER